MGLDSLRRPAIAVAIAMAYLVAAPIAANEGGVFGLSGNPDANAGESCTLCHVGGITPDVTLSGPVSVDGLSRHRYTLEIVGGQAFQCGFDVSATAGTLHAIEVDTRPFNDDVTHAEPRSADEDGRCVFSFEWTAPVASGAVTFFAAGNSVDGDLTTAGDRSNTATLVVDVDGASPGELPPVADADGPYASVAGNPISFDGGRSFDPDGSIVDYAWDFGDGTTASGSTVAHSYATEGSYPVVLTVTDDDGRIDTDETVANVFGAAGSLRTVRVAREPALRGVSVFLTAPAEDERIFVARRRRVSGEAIGGIDIIADGARLPIPFLEIEIGLFGSESGIRGIAFAPDYAASGFFYVLYTQRSGDTVVSRFRVSDDDPNLADPESEEVLVRVPQPSPASHNGSHLEFGPDGMLYIGLGDGGGSSAPSAQDDALLLGKFLRIDVSGAQSGYRIPSDNPFVGPGPPLDEIWSKGWRNPYRFSIDPETGDIYVADVGRAEREEVSVDPGTSFGGTNFGWDFEEGSFCLSGSPRCDDGSLREPIHEYAHDEGRCSIIGGVLYRGAIPDVAGRYFFSDWCTNEIWSLLWDGAGGIADLRDHTAEFVPDVGDIRSIAAMGRDGFGELLILDSNGGEIFRLLSGDPDADGDFVPDAVDNCPNVPNRPQRDSNGDGIGDACSTLQACNDGIDNDGDGRIDSADAGCDDPMDTSERSLRLTCDDGIDNDLDGVIDVPADTGCWTATDPSEAPDCVDGLDNDGDGRIDLGADPGCTTTLDRSEKSPLRICDDGLDNDGDGLVDFPGDGGCDSPEDPSERPTCADGLDNDGDGLIDDEDNGCSGPTDPSEEGDCGDGVDNDGDGLADFGEDPGCTNPLDTDERSPLLACDDGLDNDGDGLVDSPEDPECYGPSAPSESPACSDGLDNDGDGRIDFDGGELAGLPVGDRTLPDPDCSGPQGLVEAVGCGLGPEVLGLLAVLALVRRFPSGIRPRRVGGGSAEENS